MKPRIISLKDAVRMVDAALAHAASPRLELVKLVRRISVEHYDNGKSNAIFVMQRIVDSNNTDWS